MRILGSTPSSLSQLGCSASGCFHNYPDRFQDGRLVPHSDTSMTMYAQYAQTRTPYQLLDRPCKAVLVDEFLGKPVSSLRTPAMVIDRKLFAENCAEMHQRSKTWGASFRAHLKTHKVAWNMDTILGRADSLGRRQKGRNFSLTQP
jgi:hypothetical protein